MALLQVTEENWSCQCPGRKAETTLGISKRACLMQGIGSKGIGRAERAKRGRCYPEFSNCRKLPLLFRLEPQKGERHRARVRNTVTPAVAAAEQDSRSQSPADATGVCGPWQPYAPAVLTSGPTLVGAHTCLLELQIEAGAVKKNQSGLMPLMDRIEEKQLARE